MSRKSIALPPRAQPKPARAAANPTQEALRRLADMIGRGFDGARMEREVATLLTDWSGTLDMDDLRERLDEMRDQLADGIEAAEEQATEIDDEKAVGLAARRTMQALRATHSALSQASSVF